MLFISAHILNLFRKLWSFRMCHKAMDIHSEEETSHTTQYQVAFVNYVENEYWAKHRCVPVNKPEHVLSSNFIPAATTLGSSQSFFDPCELSSDDEQYSTPNIVAETTPRRSNRTALLLTAARLYLKSPSEEPKNWGQNNWNLNDSHSDQMDMSSSFWIPDITDWWCQHEKHPHWMLISPMRCATYSLSHHMVMKWRQVFPLDKKLAAVGSQNPQRRCSAKKPLEGSLLKPLTGFWQVMTQH